ncbi:hypothetical protein LINPERPRIM_LOCUS20408, partial [Linum perenne]
MTPRQKMDALDDKSILSIATCIYNKGFKNKVLSKGVVYFIKVMFYKGGRRLPYIGICMPEDLTKECRRPREDATTLSFGGLCSTRRGELKKEDKVAKLYKSKQRRESKKT